jgi:hypothetical protein
MLEEPCIIQRNIDRYRAMPRGQLAATRRTQIEQLLEEATRQLGEAIRQLARAIDPDLHNPPAAQALS